MLRLHIKGDLLACAKQCAERSIELTSIQCRYRHGVAECFAACEARFEPKVRAWYHDDAEIIDGYGYPAGTLLHFTTPRA